MADAALGAASYLGYVTAGYVVAAAGLGVYFAHLLYRARRARARARAAQARRAG